jgi:hypothetical protein
MSDTQGGTGDQQYCCAAGVCCDMAKQEAALIRLFERAHLTTIDAAEAAKVIMANFDMLPKAAGLGSVIKYVQAHLYR